MLTTRRLLLLTLWGALFALALRNVSDGDFWWHLRTGQYILETASIPQQDIFSYTRAGQPWVTHEWLSQVLIAALFRLGGFGALIITFAGIIATSFYIAFRRSGSNLYVAAPLTLLGALTTAVLWDARPQMIALLLTSVWLWVLDRYRANEGTRVVWVLIPLMVLWVNAHGSFPLGIALSGVYWVGGLLERWMDSASGGYDASGRISTRGLARLAAIIGLLVLVIPLNPNGIRMYTYSLETLNDPRMQAQIAEWQSPDFHRIELWPLLGLILLLVGVLARARRRPTVTEVLLLLVGLFEALRSVRFIPLFALVAIPVLVRSLPATAMTGVQRVKRGALLVNWGTAALLTAALTLYAVTVVQNQPRAENAFFPVAAVEYIQKAKPAGALFNLYEWGGYLAYKLYPDRSVFIDGRSDIYESLIDDYLMAYRAEPGWRAVLDRFHVGLVLLPPKAPLVDALVSDTGWVKLYQDERAVLVSRRTSER